LELLLLLSLQIANRNVRYFGHTISFRPRTYHGPTKCLEEVRAGNPVFCWK
jgi:hypothetical protein